MKVAYQQVVPPRTRFDFETTTQYLLGVFGDTWFVGGSSTLYTSTDEGATLTSVNVFTDETPTMVFVLPEYPDVWLVFTLQGSLWRTGDAGSTWTQALTDVEPPLYAGIHAHLSTVVFAEYSTTAETLRIMRSTNQGANWTAVKSLTDIRHFHSVDRDPYTGDWYVTSGDTDSESRWWKSTDSGATFTAITNMTGVQVVTLGLSFPSPGAVVWASDADAPLAGIYKASTSDLPGTMERVYTLEGDAFVMAELPPALIVGTYNESRNRRRVLVSSVDGGETWEVDLVWRLEDGATVGGFQAVHGVDDRGVLWLRLANLEGQLDYQQLGLKLRG
jgi:hypothetical protein